MSIILILSNLLFTFSHADNTCNQTPTPIAWGLTDNQFNRMVGESELKANQKLSNEDKVKKVEQHILTQSHSGLDVITADELAEKVVAVSECTGIDFAYLSAILKVESRHCLDRYNNNSAASGCGQFTSSPMNVYKNQLRLPGKKENGHPKFKKAIHELLNRCFKNKKRVEHFETVFSQSIGNIRKYLQSGADIELDLVASAIYLKFKFARTGCYYKPKSKDLCAVSLYGEGASYGTKVHNQFQKVQYQCFDHQGYLEEVLSEACSLSEDKEACESQSIEI